MFLEVLQGLLKRASHTLLVYLAYLATHAHGTLRPKDLDELLPLLTKARETTNPSSKLKEAIEYAEMVVKYVSDGSGTQDMIDRATRQLKEAGK